MRRISTLFAASLILLTQSYINPAPLQAQQQEIIDFNKTVYAIKMMNFANPAYQRNQVPEAVIADGSIRTHFRLEPRTANLSDIVIYIESSDGITAIVDKDADGSADSMRVTRENGKYAVDYSEKNNFLNHRADIQRLYSSLIRKLLRRYDALQEQELG